MTQEPSSATSPAAPHLPVGETGLTDDPFKSGVDGRLLFSQLASQPAPLTRLQARQRDGHVEVLVPPTV